MPRLFGRGPAQSFLPAESLELIQSFNLVLPDDPVVPGRCADGPAQYGAVVSLARVCIVGIVGSSGAIGAIDLH